MISIRKLIKSYSLEILTQRTKKKFFFAFFRLKKIQDKKKIARAKADITRQERKDAEAAVANLLDEGDEDLLF